LDYEDDPKTSLLNERLENLLKEADLDYIACVSGWVDIYASEVLGLKTLGARKEALHRQLKELFPDKEWFMEKIILIPDTDNRCSYFDLDVDWFYVDDWADKFFTEAHSNILYEKENGKRILLCDHQGDGADILKWLRDQVIKC